MVKTETRHSDAEQLVRSKLDELIQFRSQTDDIKEFWGKQFDLGLAWVQFPEGAGGLGLNPKYQLIITTHIPISAAFPIFRELRATFKLNPSPFAPIKAAMVVIAKHCIITWFTPIKISLLAVGIKTLNNN